MAEKMDQEIKREWVEALRSGRYQQGRNVLRSGWDADAQFCCLGVLADLYAKSHGVPWAPPEEGTSAWTLPDGSVALLGHDVTEWARLNDSPSVDDPAGGTMALSALNDLGKHSFAQIADLIEEQL